MADSKVTVKRGDIVKADERYIAHQCNCTTDYVRGVAKEIFDAYPVAGWYLNAIAWTIPQVGSIQMTETRGKIIVNMFAQRLPGKARGGETEEERLKWFRECLNKLAVRIEPGADVAMPYGIGCGLAGGNMEAYMSTIEKWSENPRIGRVVLYQWD